MIRSPSRVALAVLVVAATSLAPGCRTPQDTAPWNRDDRVRRSASDGEGTRPAIVRIAAAPDPDLTAARPPLEAPPRAATAQPAPTERNATPLPPPVVVSVPARTVSEVKPSVAVALDALVDRAWSEHGMPSVVVGLVQGDELVYTRVVGYADVAAARPATLDTIYNLGSITKVFTTTLLGVLRDEGYIQLDDVVSRYLPAHVRLPTDPRGARAISLRHLATHTSGLPAEPHNLTGVPDDPWNGYTIEQLYRALPDSELVAPIGAEVSYSNLGMTLLGHVLARATGKNYAALMRDELLGPLGMDDTGLQIRDDQLARYATGYLEEDPSSEAVRWNLGCLAPAGGMATTVDDLARFVSLQFRAGEAGVLPVSGGTLAELQRPQRMFDEAWDVGLGLGWFVEKSEELGPVVRHNGGMGGHRCHVSLAPRHDVGVIVLTNRGWRSSDNPVAELGADLLAASVHALSRVGPEVFAAAEAIAEQLRSGPDARLAGLFHPEFLQRMSLSRLDRVFFGHREQGVRCTGIESILPTDEPNAARVVYRMEHGGPLGIVLQVDPEPPYQIVSLVFDGHQRTRNGNGQGARAESRPVGGASAARRVGARRPDRQR